MFDSAFYELKCVFSCLIFFSKFVLHFKYSSVLELSCGI